MNEGFSSVPPVVQLQTQTISQSQFLAAFSDITFETIALLPLPTIDRVPRSAQSAVTHAFELTLSHIGSTTPSWIPLFAFAKLVLGKPRRGSHSCLGKLIASRCVKWTTGHINDLLLSAKKYKRPAEKSHAQSPLSGPTIDPSLLPPNLRNQSISCPEDIPTKVLRRAIDLTKTGQFSRAVTALECAPHAPPDEETLAELRRLNPPSTEATVVPLHELLPPPLDRFSSDSLRKYIQSFRKGTSPGISGFRPDYLKDMLFCPSGSILEALCRVVTLIANGFVPEDARPFIFGAKQIALIKPNKKIRPIAVGECLRRLAGKCLAGQVNPDTGEFFLKNGQIGIKVPAGADAMYHSVSRLAERYSEAEDNDLVICKLDLQNAFNCISRTVVLQATLANLPILIRYAIAAYGAPVWLVFSCWLYPSECGVHQGDPLGSVLFDLALSFSIASSASCTQALDKMDLRAWYHDDGILGGRLEDVRAALDSIACLGNQGIRLNIQKCEIVAPSKTMPLAKSTFYDISPTNFFLISAFSLLGSPIGTSIFRETFASTLVSAILSRISAIRQVADYDPHAAFSLLSYCCGFCCVSWTQRCVGHLDAWADLDRGMRDALVHIMSSCSEEGLAQAFFPRCDGGCGIRPSSAHGPAALLGSLRDSQAVSEKLLPFYTAENDKISEVCTAIAPVIISSLQPQNQTQKLLSKAIDTERLRLFMHSLPASSQARIHSCSGALSGDWLITPAPTFKSWLSPRDFLCSLRRRLGQPIAARPTTCSLCHEEVADVYGFHALSCMSGGAHTRAHTTLCEIWNSFMGGALWSPLREQCPFTDPSKRVDIVCHRGLRRGDTFDIFLINSLSPAYIPANSFPAGAVAKYENNKRAKYMADAEASDMRFYPLGADFLGAFGPSSLPVIRDLAAQWAKQRNMPRWESHSRIANRLAIAIQKSASFISLFAASATHANDFGD